MFEGKEVMKLIFLSFAIICFAITACNAQQFAHLTENNKELHQPDYLWKFETNG